MVNKSRYRLRTQAKYQSGPILYWMNRDGRAYDNWALLRAQELALEHKVPLLVAYNLDPGFLGGGKRQHIFKVTGLQEVAEELEQKNIKLFLFSGSDAHEQMAAWAKKEGIGYVVTDFFPLRISHQWQTKVFAQLKDIPCEEVDAHNIVPCWVASGKLEFGAYTLRPKITKLLPEFLEEFPLLKKHPFAWTGRHPRIAWQQILQDDRVDPEIMPVAWAKPGYKAGMQYLQNFTEQGLHGYNEKRNDPNQDAQSNLSPWLHYGQIAPQRVALEVRKSRAPLDDRDAFLEELIVRRELSDNFCYYQPEYDSTEGFPNWAKANHKLHRKDKREYLYRLKDFEHGKTHDQLWNAAELQMEKEGKMHGFMRMYWAKKILEWTASPEEAMKIAIYLNDKYELDGRDPNGYTGIAWSIGGVHDRAWVSRPVYGQIRYMNENGCRRKFDVDAYIKAWL